jgi:sugar/nucleoside kinase (ribokinase family)
MTTVVSLGIHIVDILGRPVTQIPDGQHVDLLEEIRITVAGTAAGTSIDLAKLGARVIAMGALGQDELGNFVVHTMQSYGIETHHLRRKAGVQTSATMLPIRPNGERPALHVPGANGALTLEDIDFDAIAQADFLHVGGTSLMPRFDGPPARSDRTLPALHRLLYAQPGRSTNDVQTARPPCRHYLFPRPRRRPHCL